MCCATNCTPAYGSTKASGHRCIIHQFQKARVPISLFFSLLLFLQCVEYMLRQFMLNLNCMLQLLSVLVNIELQ